jgi:hypothetical protein
MVATSTLNEGHPEEAKRLKDPRILPVVAMMQVVLDTVVAPAMTVVGDASRNTGILRLRLRMTQLEMLWWT